MHSCVAKSCVKSRSARQLRSKGDRHTQNDAVIAVPISPCTAILVDSRTNPRAAESCKSIKLSQPRVQPVADPVA